MEVFDRGQISEHLQRVEGVVLCMINFMNFIYFSNEISRLFQNQNANYRKLSFDGSNNLSVYILIPRWPGVFTGKTNREIQN